MNTNLHSGLFLATALLAVSVLVPAIAVAQTGAADTGESPDENPAGSPADVAAESPAEIPAQAPEPVPAASPETPVATAANVEMEALNGSEPVVLFHATPAALKAGHRAILRATIKRDHKLERAWVGVRAIGAAEYRELPLERADDHGFAAVVPRELVQPPGIEYYIASKGRDGVVRQHFATAQSPSALLVSGDTRETITERRLGDHGGNRSSFQLRGEATLYGRRLADPMDPKSSTDKFTDNVFLTEAEYHYRFLTTLHDIRFGVGLLRGQHPEVTGVPVVDGDDPGLNYGWSEVNFALHDNLSFGARLILGASEDGFAAGVGGVVRIGPLTQTHLEVGGELLQDVGNRGWLAFKWTTVPKVPMGFAIEVTERPDGTLSPPGTRLIYDAGVQLADGFLLTGRIGYAARTEALEGGIVGGFGAVYEF